ncbi:MAG: SRPBCC family protein [Actinomycetota bacterium]
MGGSGKLTVTTPSDTEIQMTRVFDAPRDLVFEAHSSAEHMKNWWGPRKYETISAEVDFRPGGKWRIVHRGPDGEEYGFHGEFREIVRPERIVWTFEFEGAPGQVAVETLTLEEHDGKTTLTAVSDAGSKEARDAVLESGMTEGAAETFDRLDEYLETMKAGRNTR